MTRQGFDELECTKKFEAFDGGHRWLDSNLVIVGITNDNNYSSIALLQHVPWGYFWTLSPKLMTEDVLVCSHSPHRLNIGGTSVPEQNCSCLRCQIILHTLGRDMETWRGCTVSGFPGNRTELSVSLSFPFSFLSPSMESRRRRGPSCWSGSNPSCSFRESEMLKLNWLNYK